MNLRVRRTFKSWILVVSAVLLVGILWFAVNAVRKCSQLSCTLESGAANVQCENQTHDQLLEPTPLSNTQELVIERVQVARDESSAQLSITLKGKFWNETDQNLYVFVGQRSPADAAVSYSLSADTQFFADVSYPIRNTINLPHTNDVRIGVMAPGEVQYSPQIYITDPVYADYVGRDTHLAVRTDGNEVILTLPTTEYYKRKQTPVPDHLSFTVATARDYVGFIDEMSVVDVGPQETKSANTRLLAPSIYPVLNYDSHVVKNLTLKQQNNAPLTIEFETLSQINDWAQTNLHLFFVPAQDHSAGSLPFDPSHSITLPARWSYYCAVYSPHRLFCKASNGSDFSYDTGYSGRSLLEQPKGIEFRELGGTRYTFLISPEVVEQIKAGQNAFAVLLLIGRDGFGPSSCFGFECNRRCQLIRRLKNALP